MAKNMCKSCGESVASTVDKYAPGDFGILYVSTVDNRDAFINTFFCTVHIGEHVIK